MIYIPCKLWHTETIQEEDPLYHQIGYLIIRVNFNNADHENSRLYSISDSRADSTVVGRSAHILYETGRHARILGYDSTAGLSARIPIVVAYLKAINSYNRFIIVKVNKSPYIHNSDTTLISEYEVCNNNNIIVDSYSSEHITLHTPLTYRIQQIAWHDTNGDKHINLINRGGTMGFPIYPYKKGDDLKYPVVELTSSNLWVPSVADQHKRYT